jgi:hypothetical protein
MHQTTFAGLALAGITALAGANIASNGGFESGAGQDADNWNEIEIFGGTGGAMSSADRVSGSAYTGDWAMQFNVTGAPDFGPVAEIQQLTANGSVVGGVEYNFSFWAAGTPGPGSVAFYEVLCCSTATAATAAAPRAARPTCRRSAMAPPTPRSCSPAWWPPTSADSVLIQIRLVTGAFTGASGQLTVDDVSFAAVPAPGALALLGIGGLAAARRRRA